MPTRPITFRTRLIAAFVFVALAAALAVGVIALALISAYTTRTEHDYLSTNALRIAGSVIPLLDPPQPATRQQLATTTRFYSFLIQARVVVRAPQGDVLADSGLPPNANTVAFFPPPNTVPPNASGPVGANQPPVAVVLLPPDQPRPQPPPGQAPNASVLDVAPAPFGGGFSVVDQPPDQPARSTQTIEVPVFAPADHRLLGYVRLSDGPTVGGPLVNTLYGALAIGLLAGVLVACAAALSTARYATRPLSTLSAATRRMTAGNLSARAPVVGDDEFARLATQFNRMAGQVETSFAAVAADRAALRRFVADAAHELRTPLTAAMTFVELLDTHEYAREAYTQLERLRTIVTHLLDLSLLDAGAARLHSEPGDLRTLARAALTGIAPLAASRTQQLVTALPDTPLPARYDERYLRQALDNLLANAVKFTPPAGTITLGGTATADQVLLWITDTGPGIPPEDLPHLFTRFFRGRNGAHTAGSGLGLAIAFAVVTAHAGTLTAESLPAAGARFTLRLPRADA